MYYQCTYTCLGITAQIPSNTDDIRKRIDRTTDPKNPVTYHERPVNSQRILEINENPPRRGWLDPDIICIASAFKSISEKAQGKEQQVNTVGYISLWIEAGNQTEAKQIRIDSASLGAIAWRLFANTTFVGEWEFITLENAGPDMPPYTLNRGVCSLPTAHEWEKTPMAA